MKKILYMLLCVLMLVGCTHQNGGNTGSSSTTTSNTDPVVTTTTPKSNATSTSSLENGKYISDYYVIELDNNTFDFWVIEPRSKKYNLKARGVIIEETKGIYRLIPNNEYTTFLINPVYLFEYKKDLYLGFICSIIPESELCGIDAEYIFTEDKLPTTQDLQKYDPNEGIQLKKEE